jgi:hypothetical protein
MKRMPLLLFVLCAIRCVALPASVPESTSVVVVDFTNPALIPAHWTLQVKPDGSAHFHSERGAAPRVEGQTIEAANLDTDVRLSPAFVERLFKTARQKRLFKVNCESHMNVAFQGTKRFSYTGPEGDGSCEFNYSKDTELQGLSDAVTSLANTLVEGARLQQLLLHDRLGLDKETEVLSESVADGRANQVGSIREVLERLAADESVLERVRRRARALLARAED